MYVWQKPTILFHSEAASFPQLPVPVVLECSVCFLFSLGECRRDLKLRHRDHCHRRVGEVLNYLELAQKLENLVILTR